MMAEATRLANLAPGEWRVWIDRSAERFGVSRDTLEGLIVIKESNRPFEVKRFQTIRRLRCRCHSRARASLRNRHQGPCMELSLSRNLLGSKSFVLRHFFVRSQRRFPRSTRTSPWSTRGQGWPLPPTLRYAPPLPGHTLTASTATLSLSRNLASSRNRVGNF